MVSLVKCYKSIACMYFLSDALPHLSRLSCIFQKQNVDLTLIPPCLKTTIDAIKLYKDSPGPNLRKLDDVLATDLKDFQITPIDAQKEQLKSTVQLKYIEALTAGLEKSLPRLS